MKRKTVKANVEFANLISQAVCCLPNYAISKNNNRVSTATETQDVCQFTREFVKK